MAPPVNIEDIPELSDALDKIYTIESYFTTGELKSNAVVGYKTIEGGYIRMEKLDVI